MPISKFQEEVSQSFFLEVEPYTLGDQMKLVSSVMVILNPDKHLRESNIWKGRKLAQSVLVKISLLPLDSLCPKKNMIDSPNPTVFSSNDSALESQTSDGSSRLPSYLKKETMPTIKVSKKA